MPQEVINMMDQDHNKNDIEPNRVAEFYRTHQAPEKPVDIEKQICCIEIFEDSTTALGSSNMSGRQWSGSVFLFSVPEAAPDRAVAICGVGTSSGVTDLKFLATGKMLIVGEDSGQLSLWALRGGSEGPSPSPQRLDLLRTKTEHDDCVTSMSVCADSERVLTCSLDKCVKVWTADLEHSSRTIRPAHSQGVESISCCPTEPSIFATGARDGMAIMWDLRQEKPAQLVLQSKCGVRAVTWRADGEWLAVGCEDGSISLLDPRKPGDSTLQGKSKDRPVVRLAACPTRSELLAVCGDDNLVTMLDWSTGAQLYEDNRHSDFVRGLAWAPRGSLYSCGFDKKVFKHVHVASRN